MSAVSRATPNAETRERLRRLEHKLAGGPPDLSKWSWTDLMALGSVVLATHDALAKRDDLLSVKGSIALLHEILTELAKRQEWQPAPARDQLYRWIRDCAKSYRLGGDA